MLNPILRLIMAFLFFFLRFYLNFKEFTDNVILVSGVQFSASPLNCIVFTNTKFSDCKHLVLITSAFQGSSVSY